MVSVRLQFIDWLRNTERWADERLKRVNRLLMRQAKYYQELMEALRQFLFDQFHFYYSHSFFD